MDPRELKTTLENNGLSSWIDIERLGQGGLFEDIVDGLKNAKVPLKPMLIYRSRIRSP